MNAHRDMKKQMKDENKRKNMVVILYVQAISKRLGKSYKKHGRVACTKPHQTIGQVLVYPKDKVKKVNTQAWYMRSPAKIVTKSV